MKNFKRTLALVLAVIMVVGTFASVSAATTAWYDEGVQYIENIGVAKIGNTAEDKITRNEFVLWIAKIESRVLDDDFWKQEVGNVTYTDVNVEEHNAGAIAYATRRGLVEGNGDGTFDPDKNLTLAEASAVIVRIMRYQNKVEGKAEDWAWNYMDVAQDYCDAYDATFLSKVNTYNPDYELTKGQTAYLLATVMNGLDSQWSEDKNGKLTVYKSATIDGFNLGAAFDETKGASLRGNLYTITTLNVDPIANEIDGDVVLTPVAKNGTAITVSASKFLQLVRTSLGLSATAAGDEAEINIYDTVKPGNLVDVVLKNGAPASLTIASNSVVINSTVMQYVAPTGFGTMGYDVYDNDGYNYHAYYATISDGYTSDVAFSWESVSATKATFVFGGSKFTVNVNTTTGAISGDLKILVADENGVLSDYVSENKNAKDLTTLVPMITRGEVVMVINDSDNDGKKDTLVVVHSTVFETVPLVNQAYYTHYMYPGYQLKNTTSDKIELLVLAQGRYEDYPADQGATLTSDRDKYTANTGSENVMLPYATATIANLKSGVIEESTLIGDGDSSYFSVKVKTANGDKVQVYLPTPATLAATTGTYSKDQYTFKFAYDASSYNALSGVEDSMTLDWEWAKMLKFVQADNLAKLEVLPNDSTDPTTINAARLVGQYITFAADEKDRAYYCVGAADSLGGAEDSIVLDVEKSNAGNSIYNVTVATLDDNNDVTDVKILSVNSSASAMFDNANTTFYKNLFEKNAISGEIDGDAFAGVVLKDNKDWFTATDYIGENFDNPYTVKAQANGIYSYVIKATDREIDFTRWTGDLNSEVSVSDVVTIKYYVDNVLVATLEDGIYDLETVAATKGVVASDDNKKIYFPTTGAINAVVTYTGSYYYSPVFAKGDKETDTAKLGENDYTGAWTLVAGTSDYKAAYTFGADQSNVTSTTAKNSEYADILWNTTTSKFNTWIVVYYNETTNSVTPIANYAAHDNCTDAACTAKDSDDTTDDDCTVWNLDSNKSNYALANVYADADGNLKAMFDYRGLDKDINITADAIVTVSGVVYRTINNITVNGYKAALTDAAKNNCVVKAATAKLDPTATIELNTIGNSVAAVTSDTSIANVTFTKMEATEKGYIPGTYWFSISGAPVYGFDKDGKYTTTTANIKTSIAEAYRVTTNTEVVLLTPTANGWDVEVMTPAEAAERDLIITHYNFVTPAQLTENKNTWTTSNYSNYENKLEAIVLIGQDAILPSEDKGDTTTSTDDGKLVGTGEALVYVPSDVETVLISLVDSDIVTVATNKSMVDVMTGDEIGSIYYEYKALDLEDGKKEIKTKITTGWYVVTNSETSKGKIVESVDIEAADTTNKYNGKYVNDAELSVVNGEVIATVYVNDKNGKDTATVHATYNVEEANLFYTDAQGNLKAVTGTNATFASDAVFSVAMKTAKTALETAEANYTKYVTNGTNTTLSAKYKAAYEQALADYEVALATNVDKYFNGDIWASFKTTLEKEAAIQGQAGEYSVNVYDIEGTVIVILNTSSIKTTVAGDEYIVINSEIK